MKDPVQVLENYYDLTKKEVSYQYSYYMYICECTKYKQGISLSVIQLF